MGSLLCSSTFRSESPDRFLPSPAFIWLFYELNRLRNEVERVKVVGELMVELMRSLKVDWNGLKGVDWR